MECPGKLIEVCNLDRGTKHFVYARYLKMKLFFQKITFSLDFSHNYDINVGKLEGSNHSEVYLKWPISYRRKIFCCKFGIE